MIQIGNQEYLTTDEAAAILGLTVDSVRRYCNDSENPKIKAEKIGRDWLIPPQEIRRFQEKQRPAGRPKKAE